MHAVLRIAPKSCYCCCAFQLVIYSRISCSDQLHADHRLFRTLDPLRRSRLKTSDRCDTATQDGFASGTIDLANSGDTAGNMAGAPLLMGKQYSTKQLLHFFPWASFY